MPRMVTLVVMALGLGCLTTGRAEAQQRDTVRLARPANSAVVTGSVQGTRYRDHVLHVRAGQNLEITVLAPSANMVLVRVFPIGRVQGEEVPNTATGNDPWRGTLPIEGDYAIRVTLPASGAPSRGAVNYRLRINLLDAPQVQVFVVPFICADRSALQVVFAADRMAARVERLGQTWQLPRSDSTGGIRFSEAGISFTSVGEEAILERRGLPSLRCRRAGQ